MDVKASLRAAGASAVATLRARGLTLSRLQQVHPAIDLAVLRTRRRFYLRDFFAAGPRKQGTASGRTFVIINHCYNLDADALCAADSRHSIWVLDPFVLFNDVTHFFPPEQRDVLMEYGAGPMRETLERYKAAFAKPFARELKRRTNLDALITPSDTAYYIRPLIEELQALGVPTIAQDKEGTIAPSAMMDEHAAVLAKRYPPLADHFFFWNDTHCDFWNRAGVPRERSYVIGQPRSDFFFHPDRWPPRSSLGLTEGKRLVVFFTFDSDAYLRVTEPLPDRPWLALRNDVHASLRALARERDDLEVVIKAHPQQAELAELVAEFAANPMPNVKLMTGAATASHLMVHADAIVGFQTTAMIEAMLTRKPVIYVGWGARHDAVADDLIPIHRSGGCVLPKQRAELDRLLRGALAGELAPGAEMVRARKAFTDRYFFNADGGVSVRVLDKAAELLSGVTAGTRAGVHAAL
jgi:hypothetical protein